MKLFTLLIFTLTTLGLHAQVNFAQDTMDLILDHGYQAEGKMIIENNTSGNLSYKYRILLDEFKGTSGWDVLMCDCQNCIENYPDTGTCNDLPPTEFWLFAVYVTHNASTPPPTKYFTLALTNPNNPSDADTVTLRTVPGAPASVNNVDNNDKIGVFPNPASNFIDIQAPAIGKATLRLLSLSGSVLIEVNTDGGNTRLNVADLPNGMYTLSITSEAAQTTRKIVLAR